MARGENCRPTELWERQPYPGPWDFVFCNFAVIVRVLWESRDFPVHLILP